ncbi:MAG: hypothetical protein JRH16_22220 [Deltaproteobacteria bacterium]|nr:hypothetical protein [Deltaproteobacteria bacterium]
MLIFTGMSWKTFLKAHWGAIAATDLFSVEVLTRTGWVRYFVLFIIDPRLAELRLPG